MRKIPPYRYNNAIRMIRFFTFSDIRKISPALIGLPARPLRTERIDSFHQHEEDEGA